MNWGGWGGDGSREERGSSGKGALAVLCSPFSLRPQKPQEGLNFSSAATSSQAHTDFGGRQRICGARWWGEAIGGMLVGQAAVGDATQPLANGPGFVCDGGATLSGGPRCFLCCPPARPAMFGVSAPWVIKRPRPGFDAAASAQQTGPPESSILTSVMVDTVTTWHPASEPPIRRRRRRQVPLNSPARSNGNVMHGYNQPKGGYCSARPVLPSPLLQSSRKCQMQKPTELSPSNETKSEKEKKKPVATRIPKPLRDRGTNAARCSRLPQYHAASPLSSRGRRLLIALYRPSKPADGEPCPEPPALHPT